MIQLAEAFSQDEKKAVVGIQTKLRVAYQFKTAAHYPYSSTVHTPLLSAMAQQE